MRCRRSPTRNNSTDRTEVNGMLYRRSKRPSAVLAVTSAMTPAARRKDVVERDLRAMDFYLEAGRSGDSERLFRPPTDEPVVSVRAVPRLRLAAQVEIVENLRFDSSYVPA